MMKKILLLSSWFLLASRCIAQQTGDLTVLVSNISAPSSGKIVLMVFDKEAGFPRYPEQARYSAAVMVTGGTLSHTFSGLPVGTYAVSAFHDKNNNGEMDANFLGLPREPVGASNMNQLGKPSFTKSAFPVGEGVNRISLRMLNH